MSRSVEFNLFSVAAGPAARSGLWVGRLAFLFACLAGTTSLPAAPNITGFSRLYGSASDPSYIFIFGSGFYPSTTRSVSFGGVPSSLAYPVTTNGGIDYFLQTLVPAGVPVGPVAVVVTIDGYSVQSPWSFYVVGTTPYIHDFSPTTGGDSVTVTLNGENFAPNNVPSVSSVTFNGVNASSFHVGFDNSMTAVTPANVTSGPIQVTTTTGSFTTSSNYFAPPKIAGFSPASGKAGTLVTLTGANFLGASSVQFNGLAVSVSPANNTNLQVAVPVGASSGPISIVAPANPFTTTSNFLILPTITGFSPSAGGVGSAVIVQGANFTDGAAAPTVRFNGITASVQTTNTTASQLIANVPAGASTGLITVSNANGVATSSTPFYLPPTITSFTPTSGGVGTSVALTGANLTGASAVSFNGTPAAGFSVVNNTSLTATAPASVTTGPISVTTPGGTTNSGSLVFYGAPLISTVAPAHGLTGTNVVVSGLNFQGATAVTFNGLAASGFVVSNNTTLSAVVPPYATSGPVGFVTAGGTAASPSAFVIDTSDLSVTATATASPITVGSNLTYVITVTNAGPYTAPNARLGDTLPSLTNLVAKYTTLGSFSTNIFSTNPLVAVLVCSFGDLPVGGSAVVTLVNKAPLTPGLVTNLASVAADDGDPVSLNSVFTNFTLVQSLPLLSIQAVPANLVQIIWPADLTNYQLQYKSDPTTNVLYWTNDVQTPVASNLSRGLRLTVTETNAGANRVYRLKR